MQNAQNLEFNWGGIDFRMLPQPWSGHRSAAPVVLLWRHPSGQAGSRYCAGMADAMRHSSSVIETLIGTDRAAC